MATLEQRKRLLANPCPWCRAAAGADCASFSPKTARPITTLDGGCHDARWVAAFGTHARVTSVPGPAPEPVPVERPW